MGNKLQLIEEMQLTVDRLKVDVANADATLKAKKTILKEAEGRLSTLIRLGEDALKEQTALFPEEMEEPGTKHAKAKKAEAGGDPKDGPKGWQKRPIKDAITLGSVVNALEVHDQPCTTLGDLILWLKKHDFTHLNGVGAEKAGKAADQLGEFWKANPHYKH
jgi:hypothetical protein